MVFKVLKKARSIIIALWLALALLFVVSLFNKYVISGGGEITAQELAELGPMMDEHFMIVAWVEDALSDGVINYRELGHIKNEYARLELEAEKAKISSR